MAELRKIALDYRKSEEKYGDERELYHYNCAEVILNASNDYYNLAGDKSLLKAVVPFGGGMFSEKVCGALTGGIMALGLLFAEEKPSKNEKLKEVTNRWVMAFEEKFNNLNCGELKEEHRDPESGCERLILDSAELLESIIDEYK